MKKTLSITILVLLVAVLAVVPAFAGSEKANVKGYVLPLEEGTLDSLQIETREGETVTIMFATPFEAGDFVEGDYLLVKGTFQEDGSVLADRVLNFGPKTEDDEDDTDPDDGEEEEGGKSTSAYCTEGQKDKDHPFAVKLTEKYPESITVEEVMGYFCDGVGMGQIMLALMTSEKFEGEEGLDVATLISMRKDGKKGWGQIWKELKLIGSEKEADSPPGHLKRPEHAGPKNKDK